MNKDNIFLSASILISGVLIAGAVIYSTGRGGVNVPSGDVKPSEIHVNPITSNDHILGDPKAPIKLIEFSDLQCPYCSRFHPTLQQIVKEYSGKVAWIYRHFPLESIHPYAREAAIGSECAAELGGNDKFWAYVDAIFKDQEKTLVNLPGVATSLGLNATAFSACIKSNKYDDVLAKDTTDATNSGGQGTPWTVVINAKGKTFPINGALPYEQVKAVIEQALK